MGDDTSRRSRSAGRADEAQSAGLSPKAEFGAEDLLPQVYGELRKLARARMAHEGPGHTLQATALVHEAYLRLLGSGPRGRPWANRAHFFAAAAEAMRRILIERARRVARSKHGGGQQRVTLIGDQLGGYWPDIEMLALDAALQRLAAVDPEMARVVELRAFAGLTIDETAQTLDTSPRTVKRRWTAGRAWLQRELAAER